MRTGREGKQKGGIGEMASLRVKEWEEVSVGNCLICGGDGMVMVDGGLEDCGCKLQAERSRWLKEAGIPARYEQCEIGTFVCTPDRERIGGMMRQAGYLTKVFETVEKFVKDLKLDPSLRMREKTGLLFQGPHGRGKTHLAVGVLRAAVLAGIPGKFVNYSDYLEAIAKNVKRHTRDVDPKWERASFRDVPLLLMDNLGLHRGLDWIDDSTYDLMDHRYSHRLPFVATTSLTLGAPPVDDGRPAPIFDRSVYLRGQIGVHAYQRLMDMCQVIEL